MRCGIARALSLAVAAALLCGPAAHGQTFVATGPITTADGYLEISADEYGSWASVTFGGGGDNFNPAGALGLAEPTFSSGFFLFDASGTQRELLSDNASWQAVFAPDASLDRTVLLPNSAADTNGDGVDDMIRSRFRVFGGATDLECDLTQAVSVAGPGVATMYQEYTFTNVATSPIFFALVRAYDGDLPWTGGANFFADDEVGTTMNGAGLGTYVFEQEASEPSTTAVTVSSPLDGVYYGGKRGIDPLAAGLPFDFGTDTEIWDAFGVPANWFNFIANVGALTNGVSGSFPPGSVAPQDGFVGLELRADLDPGESTTIVVIHTYGRNRPCPADTNGDGVVNVLDLLGVLGAWGPITPCPPFAPEDVNYDCVVNVFDLLDVLAAWGPC